MRGTTPGADADHFSIMRGRPTRRRRTAHQRRSPTRCTSIAPEPGGRGELADVVDARPWTSGTARCARPAHCKHGPLRPRTRRRVGRARPPPGPRAATSSPARSSRRDRVTADADVAVGEQRGLPAALAGQPVEDVAAQRRRRPAPRVWSTASGTTSTPSTTWPSRASAAVSRPGPQPRSTVWPRQRPSKAEVLGDRPRGATGAPAAPGAGRPARPRCTARPRSAALNTSVNDARRRGSRERSGGSGGRSCRTPAPTPGEPRARRQPRHRAPRRPPRRRRRRVSVVPTSRPAAVSAARVSA